MAEKQERLPKAAASSWAHGDGPARLTLIYAASAAPRLVPGQVVRYDGVAVQVHTLVVENREDGGRSATYVLHALPTPGNSPLAG